MTPICTNNFQSLKVSVFQDYAIESHRFLRLFLQGTGPISVTKII